jgi:hypothetical protein
MIAAVLSANRLLWLFAGILLLSLVVQFESPEQASAAEITIRINSTDDMPDQAHDGLCKTIANTCSLRAAIKHALNTGAANSYILHFGDIPGTGVPTFAPTAAYDVVAFVVTIDGATHSSGRVELSGENATASNHSGLVVTSAGPRIHNMVINRFPAYGFIVIGGSGAFARNTIGLDATRRADMGNGSGGILITGVGNNQVGPDNMIAGNGDTAAGTGAGVEIVGEGADNNRLENNIIGANVSDSILAQPRGVFIHGGADSNVVGGEIFSNLIAGSTIAGVDISDSGTTLNIVLNNTIGTNDADSTTLENAIGVWIHDSASNNTIGGTVGVSAAGLIFDDRANLISSNAEEGILIEESSENVVIGNWVGLNYQGTGALPNGSSGIRTLNASDNQIGGSDPGERNVISGNLEDGVMMDHSDGDTIVGNYIGLNPAGTSAIGNDRDGVRVQHSTGTTVYGNTISGNVGNTGGSGINVNGALTDQTAIRGNQIGLSANGQDFIPNGARGIQVSNLAAGTGIVFNTVAGHSQANIRVAAGGTSVLGNFIGFNGEEAATTNGVGIDASNGQVTIGSASFGLANVIGGNTDGILLAEKAGLSDSFIVGNYIGAIPGGDPIPNSGHGIFVKQTTAGGFGSDDVAIGTEMGNEGNVIAYNGGAGVRIEHGDSTGFSVMGNSIYKNGGLGIDLGAVGVTPNDALDADIGPNNLTNFPTIEITGPGAGTINLDAEPSKAYLLSLFGNDECDPSGNGEGQFLRFSTLETTDGTGHLEVEFDDVPGLLTATATEDIGGNTSEFSACVDAGGGATPTPSPSPTPSPTPTPTLPATPTAVPTPTPTGATASPSPSPTASAMLRQGDFNCDGNVDANDLTILLENVALGTPFQGPPPCPAFGSAGPPLWGDVNCDGVIDVSDLLAMLLHLAQLPYTKTDPCTDISAAFP